MYEAFIVCLRSSSSITDRQAFHNLQKHSDTKDYSCQVFLLVSSLSEFRSLSIPCNQLISVCLNGVWKVYKIYLLTHRQIGNYFNFTVLPVIRYHSGISCQFGAI